MAEFVLLRLEGPLQAWGDVAMDPQRPTRAFPARSALAGLLANALGWTHRDGDRINDLQDALTYAVREDRRPVRIRDYQTVNLGREAKGWTRWGIEERGGAFSKGTHILEKEYLADGSLLVALTLAEPAPVDLDALARALTGPARPLFLGRKSCPPAVPIFEGRIEADTPYEALRRAPAPSGTELPDNVRCWYAAGEGPEPRAAQTREVWDRRDYTSQRFVGARTIVEGVVDPASVQADT